MAEWFVEEFGLETKSVEKFKEAIELITEFHNSEMLDFIDSLHIKNLNVREDKQKIKREMEMGFE
jgi:hypothetical protein